METVLELVEDVVERASNIIFERFIASEIFPYAVEAARKNILKMIAVRIKPIPCNPMGYQKSDCLHTPSALLTCYK